MLQYASLLTILVRWPGGDGRGSLPGRWGLIYRFLVDLFTLGISMPCALLLVFPCPPCLTVLIIVLHLLMIRLQPFEVRRLVKLILSWSHGWASGLRRV